jgi:hypothetical protein
MNLFKTPYTNLDAVIQDIVDDNAVLLIDHLGGFDANGNNPILSQIDDALQGRTRRIWHVQVLEDWIRPSYQNLDIRFDFRNQYQRLWKPFETYNIHPEQQHRNFICSFNGSDHVCRKMLVAILKRMHWFDPGTCSKNFTYDVDTLDGHIQDFLDPEQCRFYRKFFIDADSQNFGKNRFGFGHVRYDHAINIYNLEHKITDSFLHIVSETLATSYHPFVTEKFLYSVVTRGLFLAYGQPGWHDHLQRYYGFRKFDKIFDYNFDSIQNPVQRLVALMSMISKFSVMSSDDWRDLYDIEMDTIEHNYDWYFSKKYIKHLEQFSS